jgi:DNA-directed RNA polymerase subunit RPC12/RpoP
VPLTLAFACPACGEAVEGALEPGTTGLACPACAVRTELPEAPALVAAGDAHACPVCGSADLYQQRDFNRKLGSRSSRSACSPARSRAGSAPSRS